MGEALRFFVQYEAVIYFILGLGGILYFYRFWMAWQELRLATFGLERQAARGRLNQAAAALFFLLVLAVIIFIMVTFVATTLPAQALLATPTLDLSFLALTPTANQTQVFVTVTPLPTVSIDAAPCIPNQLNITSPKAGDTISGSVNIRGTVDIPDFGFYKFEWAHPEEELWTTVQAGRTVVRDGVLVENWDTTRLPPGAYVLQLVAMDNNGKEWPPCRVPVQIGAPQ